MNRLFKLKTSIAVAVMLLAAAAQAQTVRIDKAAYKTGETRVSAEYKTDKAACNSMSGNAKDVCIQEAKGKEKVARAELKFDYSGKPADQTRMQVAKAEAAYAIAKKKCDDQAGNAKAVCQKEAKAVEVKAKADAKMTKQIGAAKTDAAQEKRDADYKVAAEKCNALAGDAKTGCMTDAKTKFGKT